MENILKAVDLSNIVHMYFDLQLSTTDIAKNIIVLTKPLVDFYQKMVIN